MKQDKYRSLQHDVLFNVPSDTTEWDTLAKIAGACLKSATDNQVYRANMAEFRDVFLHGRQEGKEPLVAPRVVITGIEELTGIERATKPVLKDGKPVVSDGEALTVPAETEKEYYDRVLSTLVSQGKFANEDLARSSYDSLAQQVADSIPFEPWKSESVAKGPKKLANKYKVTAARILAAGNVDAFNASKGSKVGKTFTASGDTSKMFSATYVDGAGAQQTLNVSDKDATDLGWIIKSWADWKEQQELNDAVS